MKKRFLYISALLISIIFLVNFSTQAVPRLINCQGRLTDTEGVPLNGSYNVKFHLFTMQSGGSSLWSEQQDVTIADGVYNVQLGAVNPLSTDLFDNEFLYLEVEILNSITGGWEILSPRQQLTSTAFAMRAESAGNTDTLNGLDASQFATTNHNHNEQYYSKTEVNDIVTTLESQMALIKAVLPDLPLAKPETFNWDEVPQLAMEIATEHLQSIKDSDQTTEWKDAQLASIAYSIYNPALIGAGPAYLEFKVVSGADNIPSGFIMVSLTENDSPIVEFSTSGLTTTEILSQKANVSYAKMIRYDDSFMVAENLNGQKLAHIGEEPMKIPSKILEYMDKTYEVMDDGEHGEVRPDEIPDFQLEGYESYQQFKSDYMESEVLKFFRERQKREAKIEWDVYLDREREVIEINLGAEKALFQGENVLSYEVQDPELVDMQLKDVGAAAPSFALVVTGKEAGATILRVRFVTQGDTYHILSIVDPQNPLTRYLGSWTAWTYYWAGYWSDQCRYGQESCCGCVTGCGPVAWAMLYGWWDRNGTNLIEGYAPISPMNTAVRNCISGTNSVRDYVDSYCVAGQAATNPWEMPDGKKWARDRYNAGYINGYSISTQYASPGIYTSSCRNRARDSIRDNHKPAIIGIGFTSAHYCLAYGYAWRKKKWHGITLATSRYFMVNMGHFSSGGTWKNARVWYGNKPRFW